MTAARISSGEAFTETWPAGSSSKNPGQAPLVFDAGEWAAFAAGVAAGEFRRH
jgi:hypothetical protein